MIMMTNNGFHRVLGMDTLPVLAWKLNNSKNISGDELLLRVTDILVEAASFKQICSESKNDPQEIKEKIITLVNARGKLHNPYTDTGGLIAGVVERIGSEYSNKRVKVGDRILVVISTSMIPLHIDEIREIDFVFGIIKVDGHCILFENYSIIAQPSDIPLNLLMASYEESSSLYHINCLSRGKKEFLVIGTNIVTAMLYGAAIRTAKGEKGCISVLLCQLPFLQSERANKEVLELLETVFDQVYYMNLAASLECAEALTRSHPDLFDLSVNCADARGAEAINVLVTKEKGTVFLSNMVNNYNIALYLTESVGKELSILCADGYAKDYDWFMSMLLNNYKMVLEKVCNNLYRRGSSSRLKDYKPALMGLDKEQTHIASDFVYKSRVMDELSKEIIKVSKYDCTVLIEGETGVGKEKVAQLMYNLSNRNTQAFVKVNCASVPKTLMESEFFGYEKGAFTGADARGKKGYFEQSHKGMLFLDEVSELSLEMQAKFLRVLQDREFYRVGGETPIRVDTRIIVATNKNLKSLMAQGLFREDLFYRLSVLYLHIPPLRNRKSDIPLLTEFFVNKYNQKFSMKKTISNDGIQYLMQHEWPGNIRELENLVQRLLITYDENNISAVMVAKELAGSSNYGMALESSKWPRLIIDQEGTFKEAIGAYEKQMISEALLLYRTTRKAAEALGMTQSQFMRKKKKHSL